MEKTEFELYCRERNLPEMGIRYLETVRSSPPSRRVQSGIGNVVSRFPSKKMGCVIQAESRHYELALLYQLEYDDDVIEFYDQPERVCLSYVAASGRRTSAWHTPDFLVIRRSGVELIEVKPDDRLERLALQQPHRYSKGQDGSWRCPPGEELAKNYRFQYRICSSVDLNRVLVRNLAFLDDYQRKARVDPRSAEANRVVAAIKEQPGITVEALRTNLGPSAMDVLFALISNQNVYVDLGRVLLTQPESVSVFPDKATADAFALLQEKPIRLMPGSEAYPGQVDGRDEQILSLDLIADASPSAMEAANIRYQAIMDPAFAHERKLPERTVRRWRSEYRRAEAMFGNGYVGLLPKTEQRGNRRARLADPIYEAAQEVIQDCFMTPKRVSKSHAYGIFLNKCQQLGFQAPTLKWFRQQISHVRNAELVRTREGKRAAYKFGSGRGPAVGANANHGDYPWQVVHIDHTQVDVELVDEETGENLGRPWLSLMFDAFSRRVLAFYLTFDAPSSRSLMMLLRDAVRRHERLPSSIVADWGKEFGGYFFETFTACYEVQVTKRPPAQARFGAVIEREFGTLNKQFFHNLAGNTQNTRNVRQLTKSINPKRLAVWSLERLHDLLEAFCFEVYDRRPHPGVGAPPVQAYQSGLEKTGAREFRKVQLDETFRFLTMPTTTKGTSKVQPGMGVKVFYMYYWNPAMSDPQWEGKHVMVRYDPEDLGVCYARLGKTWVKCTSAQHAAFSGRSEKQLRIAVQELKRRRSKLEADRSLSSKQVAAFFESVEAEEKLRHQRLRDRAVRNVGQKVDGMRPDLFEPQAAVSIAAPEPEPQTAWQEAVPATETEAEVNVFSDF